MRKDVEHETQKGFVDWFTLQHKPIAHLLYAIPNGGNRSKNEGKRFKAEGVKAGIPDLFLSFPAYPLHGMYIETKTKVGVVSKDQKFYLEALRKVGYRTVVCRNIEEFMFEVNRYLNGG